MKLFIVLLFLCAITFLLGVGLGFFLGQIKEASHGFEIWEKVKLDIDTDLSWDMFDEYGNETLLHKELFEIIDKHLRGTSE